MTTSAIRTRLSYQVRPASAYESYDADAFYLDASSLLAAGPDDAEPAELFVLRDGRYRPEDLTDAAPAQDLLLLGSTTGGRPDPIRLYAGDNPDSLVEIDWGYAYSLKATDTGVVVKAEDGRALAVLLDGLDEWMDGDADRYWRWLAFATTLPLDAEPTPLGPLGPRSRLSPLAAPAPSIGRLTASAGAGMIRL